MRNPSPSLPPFLDAAFGGRDVALAIARDAQELRDVAASLDASGWHEAASSRALLDAVAAGGRAYVVLTDANMKDAYDIAVQYPTGHISWFDPAAHALQAASPMYGNTGIMYLVTQEGLAAGEKKGFLFREKLGLTWRNPHL